jgi:hypothetical protein
MEVKIQTDKYHGWTVRACAHSSLKQVEKGEYYEGEI